MDFNEDYQSTIESNKYDINPFQFDKSVVEFLQSDRQLKSITQINVSPFYYRDLLVSSIPPVNVTVTLCAEYDDDSKQEIAVAFQKMSSNEEENHFFEYRVFDIYLTQ